MATPVSSKKPKTSKDNDDFQTVKRYLLECPHVTQDHPAIRAALEGIEKEEKRRDRDAKLALKFAQASTSNSPVPSDDLVVVDTTITPEKNGQNDPATGTLAGDESMESDWQDLANTKKEEDDETSFFGRELAKASIDSISGNMVRVKTPLAAIAIVFHASLRSDLLGFACTGIPEDETKKSSGFAAPVREMPNSQFLPPKWDSFNVIKLRYRKKGTGAMKLIVQEVEDRKIQVQLFPGKEPPSQSLFFSIDEHVNLDSWNAAFKQGTSIQPALHYKFLSNLLTKFCRTFDLGSVGDDVAQESQIPYMDNTISTQMNHRAVFKSDFVAPTVPTTASSQSRPWENGVPTTLDQAFPLHARINGGGDFADDLAPAGLRDPRFSMPAGGRMGGNLMGPNHPSFMGGGHPGVMGGPGTMQPRFDPMHPPGVLDIDIHGNPRRGRQSRSGEPNPDHLPPPNSFGDMFS